MASGVSQESSLVVEVYTSQAVLFSLGILSEPTEGGTLLRGDIGRRLSPSTAICNAGGQRGAIPVVYGGHCDARFKSYLKSLGLGDTRHGGSGKGVLTALCQYGLPNSYVAEVLDKPSTNCILIQRDIRDKKPASIRSISLICVSDGTGAMLRGQNGDTKYIRNGDSVGPEVADMEVLVLGSAELPQVHTRSLADDVLLGRGAALIRAIQCLGACLNNGITLFALETVISLYWRFGWRFVTVCTAEERRHYAAIVKQLYDFYKHYGTVDNQLWCDLKDSETGVVIPGARRREAYDQALGTILSNFKGFSYKYYKQLAHRNTKQEAEDKAEEEDDNKVMATRDAVKEIAERAQDNGYRMLLCQPLNPYSASDCPPGGKAGGGRSAFIGGSNGTINNWGIPKDEKKLAIPKCTWCPLPGSECIVKGGRKRRRKRTRKRALRKRHRRRSHKKKRRKTHKRKRRKRRRTRKRRR